VKRLLPILLCVWLCGCYDDRFDTPDVGTEPEAATIRIGDLRKMLREEPLTVVEPIVLRGRVTTSDREGNFYHSFLIDDGSGAAEICASISNLHTIYPPGAPVSVNVQNCAAALRNGVVQIGTIPDSYDDYAVGYIGSRQLLDRIVRCGSQAPLAVVPLERSVSDLSEEECGRLVRIARLRFIPETDPDDPGTWAGYRLFEDANQNRIAVYTSAYASFGDSPVPSEPISVTGILQYGKAGNHGKRFILKMRDANDYTL